MLGHLLVLTLQLLTILTFTCLSAGKAEQCLDNGVEFEVEYASVGEPLYAVCSLAFLLKENNFNITWIRNGEETEITLDRQERVHQEQRYLKFIPAELQDSGLYQCILRNATFCIKKMSRVEVFNYDDGLCYKDSVKYVNVASTAPSLVIECPNLDIYVDDINTQVKWFKECQPLDLKHYIISDDTLTITNLSKQDSGNYTCEVELTHNGATYKISRTMEYTISDLPEDKEPVMLFPTNNIIDVEIGAPITLTCEVLHNGTAYLFWLYNNTDMAFLDDYNDKRVIIGKMDEKSTEYGRQHFRTLNFTKVIEADYNKKFYCHVETWTGKSTEFYVTLKKPDPNFQGFLIAFFVSVFLVIVIFIIAIKIFKVDIVLWYRGSCLANSNLKVADGKIYDAYVIFPKNSMGTSSYSMDIFVLKVLPEVLEKQCAYRLFILGRDDLPGQAMMDLVDETISQSRRVIIVLGNAICEEPGEDFEQKIAMYDALIRDKIKVILIEMEKITDYTKMPESIKYIKQKQGVVRWKGEFTVPNLSPNTRFWKNIRYQMPPAQHHSDKELNYIYSED